jgi:hypothetical protein
MFSQKIRILLFSLIFGSIGCSIDSPLGLIPKDKMANILAEIHLAETKAHSLDISNSDTTNVIFRKLEAEIFKKYQVDTSSYYKSYRYYLIEPEQFSDIYKDVIEKIKIQNKIDSLADSKKPKTDSAYQKAVNTDSIKKKMFGKKIIFKKTK